MADLPDVKKVFSMRPKVLVAVTACFALSVSGCQSTGNPDRPGWFSKSKYEREERPRLETELEERQAAAKKAGAEHAALLEQKRTIQSEIGELERRVSKAASLVRDLERTNAKDVAVVNARSQLSRVEANIASASRTVQDQDYKQISALESDIAQARAEIADLEREVDLIILSRSTQSGR